MVFSSLPSSSISPASTANAKVEGKKDPKQKKKSEQQQRSTSRPSSGHVVESTTKNPRRFSRHPSAPLPRRGSSSNNNNNNKKLPLSPNNFNNDQSKRNPFRSGTPDRRPPPSSTLASSLRVVSPSPRRLRQSGSMELDNFLDSYGNDNGKNPTPDRTKNKKPTTTTRGGGPASSLYRHFRVGGNKPDARTGSSSDAVVVQDLETKSKKNATTRQPSPQQYHYHPSSSSSADSLSIGSDEDNNTFGDVSTVPSLLNDEPSLNTLRAGNLTNDDTSSALTSLVCLSLLQTATTTTTTTRAPDSDTLNKNRSNNSKGSTNSKTSRESPVADSKTVSHDTSGTGSNSITLRTTETKFALDHNSGARSGSGATTPTSTTTTNSSTTRSRRSQAKNNNDNSSPSSPPPNNTDAITRESLLRHMRFHLARVDRSRFSKNNNNNNNNCGNNSNTDDSSLSSCSDDDDDTSSYSSYSSSQDDDDEDTTTITGQQQHHHRHNLDPDQVHYKAQECLYRDDTAGAITIYRHLLAKQRKNVHAQRADTLSRLSVLCLVATTTGEGGGRRYHKKALAYSTEALKLHQNSGRPLQAAVSTMELGLVHFGANKLHKALKLWRQAMQLACVAMGYDHPHVAILLNNIGALHFSTGDYAASVRALEESVELQRSTLRYYCSPINVENAIHQLATTMSNLAVVYDQGRHHVDRAVAFLQESMALFGSVYTYEHDGMEDALAEYLERLPRQQEEMQQQQQRELSMSSRHRSSMSIQSKSSIISTNNEIQSTNDQVLQSRKNNGAARSSSLFGNNDGIPNKLSLSSSDNHDFLLFGPLENELTPEQRVRDTVMAWFGKQVDDTKVEIDGSSFVACDESMKLIGSRSRSSIPFDLDGDKFVNAELHLKEIHRHVLKHLDQNEIDDALDIFRSALRSHQEKYGDIHHLVGSTWHNIGMVQLFAKQYSSAQASFVESMNVRSAALGTGHPDVGTSKTKIALLQLAQGELDEALESFWEIRDEFIDVLGYGHPQMAKVMNNIGVVAYCRGDLEDANQSFEVAHEYQNRIREEEAGQEFEVLEVAMAHTINNMAFVATKMGDSMRALDLFEEALRTYEKFLPKDDSVLVTTQKNIQYLVASGGMGDLWDTDRCQMINPICFSFV